MRVRQVRWGSISPERCNANPCTILENRTKTNTGQLRYGCLFSTHASCFAWWSLNQPRPCPSLGFLGMPGACVTLPGCCCPLPRSRSFTVPLSWGTHGHCSSWGRAPGGDLFLRRLEDSFIKDLGAMMNKIREMVRSNADRGYKQMVSNWVYLNKMYPNVLKREGALLRRRRAGHDGRAGLSLERSAEGSPCTCAWPPCMNGQMQLGTGSWAWKLGVILLL